VTIDGDQFDARLEDRLREILRQQPRPCRGADPQGDAREGEPAPGVPSRHDHNPPGEALRGRFFRGRAREASTLNPASSPTTSNGWVGFFRRLKKRPSRVRT
jgi:hypothetical protein